MLEKLINSRTRLAILALFFKNPEKKYYAREIIKELQIDQANAHKELQNLVAGEFLIVEEINKKKHFSVNQKNVFYKGLQTLLADYRAADRRPEYICIEEMPNYYPMMVTIAWCAGLANNFLAHFAIKNRFSSLLAVYHDNFCQLIVPRAEFKKIGLEILDKLQTDPAWGQKYIQELSSAEQALYQASRRLDKLNFKQFSNVELLDIFTDYYQVYTDLHIHHWLQTILDFDENIFSKYLLNYLKGRLAGSAHSLGDVFSVLTTPVKEAKPAEEYRDLLLILQEITNNPRLKKYFSTTETRIIVSELSQQDKKLSARLKKHVEEFGFLGYNTVGPAWDVAYFIDILSSLIRQKAKPAELLRDLDKNRQHIKDRQKKLEKELGIASPQKQILEFARELVFTKGTRKDAMFQSYAVIENLFREIGARYYLSVRQVRYLHPHEFRRLLLSAKFPISILNERYHFSLHFSTGHYEKDLYLTGPAARDYLAKLNIVQEDIRNIKILQGDCASPGRVRGVVRIINLPKDMAKMNSGDILVSIATTPDLVPAIKKAAAIVTDAGGITCHAAIISRELGIPCVVGTRVSTKVLHDGDLIDVNATHGKVDIIEKAK